MAFDRRVAAPPEKRARRASAEKPRNARRRKAAATGRRADPRRAPLVHGRRPGLTLYLSPAPGGGHSVRLASLPPSASA
jgi:hypothetical protein